MKEGIAALVKHEYVRHLRSTSQPGKDFYYLRADLPYIGRHNVPLFARLLPRKFFMAAGCLAQIFGCIRDDFLAFLPAHVHEASDDGNPVKVVRDDRTVCGTVLPTEERVEDAPATGAILKG